MRPTGRITRRIPGAFLVTLLAASGLTAAWPAPAHGAGNNDFSIAPATIEGASSPRAFFDLDVSPGQVIQDRVTVVNRTDTDLNVNVYPADAYNIPLDGTFALRTLTEKRVDVGAWTRLPVENVTLPPKTQSTFPIEIRVPANAAPGDHAGGVVAVNTSQSIQQEGSARIAVNKAVGARIYLRVKGPLRPAVEVTRLRVQTPVLSAWPVQGGQRATVEYELVNTGNVRINATAKASVDDLFGRTVASFAARKVTTLLPGQKVTVQERVAHLPSLPLRLTPEVAVTVAGERTTRRGAPAYVVPWLVLVVIAIVLAAWRRRRRQRRRTTAPPHPLSTGPQRQPAGV